MGYGSKSIGDWQDEVHQTARSKGWWDDCSRTKTTGDRVDTRSPLDREKVLSTVGTKLALIHSEVSEALEDFRVDKMETVLQPGTRKPEGFGSEMADVVIRVMDLCGALGIDLEQEIRNKTAFNETRQQRHGGKRV